MGKLDDPAEGLATSRPASQPLMVKTETSAVIRCCRNKRSQSARRQSAWQTSRAAVARAISSLKWIGPPALAADESELWREHGSAPPQGLPFLAWRRRRGARSGR